MNIEQSAALARAFSFSLEEGEFFIVASQSCDVASNSPIDPNVELIVATPVETLVGDFSFNKNPRKLHTQFVQATNTDEVQTTVCVEVLAYRKLVVPKGAIAEESPCPTMRFEYREGNSFSSWLGSRYTRKAMPSAFNNRIAKIDKKKKLRKIAGRLDEHLTGIYIRLSPDTEIEDGENYNVNLLGLLPVSFTGELSDVEKELESYTEILRKAGFDVEAVLRKEDEVSVAVVNSFSRFYYDDISFKSGANLPPTTH